MMKYELALVLSAKIEDEERAAMVEKVQAMITTAGAAITNVDEWGKKQLAYSEDERRILLFHPVRRRNYSSSRT